MWIYDHITQGKYRDADVRIRLVGPLWIGRFP
jgi:hypothetical protein